MSLEPPPNEAMDLVVTVLGARKLGINDRTQCYPYACVDWQNESHYTEVLSNTLSPNWKNGTFRFPFEGSLRNRTLPISLYSCDATGQGNDEFLGQGIVDLYAALPYDSLRPTPSSSRPEELGYRDRVYDDWITVEGGSSPEATVRIQLALLHRSEDTKKFNAVTDEPAENEYVTYEEAETEEPLTSGLLESWSPEDAYETAEQQEYDDEDLTPIVEGEYDENALNYVNDGDYDYEPSGLNEEAVITSPSAKSGEQQFEPFRSSHFGEGVSSVTYHVTGIPEDLVPPRDIWTDETFAEPVSFRVKFLEAHDLVPRSVSVGHDTGPFPNVYCLVNWHGRQPFTTAAIGHSLNPVWENEQFDVDELFPGDFYRPVVMYLRDYDGEAGVDIGGLGVVVLDICKLSPNVPTEMYLPVRNGRGHLKVECYLQGDPIVIRRCVQRMLHRRRKQKRQFQEEGASVSSDGDFDVEEEEVMPVPSISDVRMSSGAFEINKEREAHDENTSFLRTIPDEESLSETSSESLEWEEPDSDAILSDEVPEVSVGRVSDEEDDEKKFRFDTTYPVEQDFDKVYDEDTEVNVFADEYGDEEHVVESVGSAKSDSELDEEGSEVFDGVTGITHKPVRQDRFRNLRRVQSRVRETPLPSRHRASVISGIPELLMPSTGHELSDSQRLQPDRRPSGTNAATADSPIVGIQINREDASVAMPRSEDESLLRRRSKGITATLPETRPLSQNEPSSLSVKVSHEESSRRESLAVLDDEISAQLRRRTVRGMDTNISEVSLPSSRRTAETPRAAEKVTLGDFEPKVEPGYIPAQSRSIREVSQASVVQPSRSAWEQSDSSSWLSSRSSSSDTVKTTYDEIQSQPRTEGGVRDFVRPQDVLSLPRQQFTRYENIETGDEQLSGGETEGLHHETQSDAVIGVRVVDVADIQPDWESLTEKISETPQDETVMYEATVEDIVHTLAPILPTTSERSIREAVLDERRCCEHTHVESVVSRGQEIDRTLQRLAEKKLKKIGQAPSLKKTRDRASRRLENTKASTVSPHPRHLEDVQGKKCRISNTPVVPSGNRRALIIACSYPALGDDLALRRDIKGETSVAISMLTNAHAIPSTPDCLSLLCSLTNDSMLPTKKTIMDGLRWLSRGASTGDVLVLHYSGYRTLAEGDSDHVMVSDTGESISKEEMLLALHLRLPEGCRLTCLFDYYQRRGDVERSDRAVEEGTRSQPYRFSGRNNAWVENDLASSVFAVPADVRHIVLKASDYSEIEKDVNRAPLGLSLATLNAEHPNGLPMSDFLEEVTAITKARGFQDCKPVITSSQTPTIDMAFSFADIAPNQHPCVGDPRRVALPDASDAFDPELGVSDSFRHRKRETVEKSLMGDVADGRSGAAARRPRPPHQAAEASSSDIRDNNVQRLSSERKQLSRDGIHAGVEQTMSFPHRAPDMARKGQAFTMERNGGRQRVMSDPRGVREEHPAAIKRTDAGRNNTAHSAPHHHSSQGDNVQGPIANQSNVPHHHHVITKIIRTRGPPSGIPHHHHVVRTVIHRGTGATPSSGQYYRLPPPTSY